MISSTFRNLDSFIAMHDPESMDWNDGGEFEIAESYLYQFEESDWRLLQEIWKNRSVQWQGCLISILCPQCGISAQDIIIEMAYSQNSAIAFEAMRVISFYCGINENSEGLFVDESIVHSQFRDSLRADSDFLASIPQIGGSVGRNYELLQNVLCCKP